MPKAPDVMPVSVEVGGRAEREQKSLPVLAQGMRKIAAALFLTKAVR